ncbi:BnaC01g41820D [Brassica napus]|uniref:BnaC01g41820D protein n=1 Tax=Brassica napus TaxID=3708 RepID=A0A078JDF9_BRANA|nr:BnaC01g41820D [Brassica napus]
MDIPPTASPPRLKRNSNDTLVIILKS